MVPKIDTFAARVDLGNAVVTEIPATHALFDEGLHALYIGFDAVTWSEYVLSVGPSRSLICLARHSSYISLYPTENRMYGC